MTDQLASGPAQRIRHRSVADETTDIVRRMILLGDLAPGQRVTQDGLSDLVGVSTMPVRESLLRLAAEGFIHALPNRSFRVVQLSRSDLVDIYWAHSLLSAELTRRACQGAGRDLVDRLRGLQEQFDRAHDSGAVDQMESLNWQFHRTVYRAADASRLVLLLRTTLRYTPIGLYSRLPGWNDETVRGHEEILAAFADHDCEAAGRAAALHVSEAGDLLIANYSAHGYWRRPDE